MLEVSCYYYLGVWMLPCCVLYDCVEMVFQCFGLVVFVGFLSMSFLIVLWPRWYSYIAMASVGGPCGWVNVCAMIWPVGS